MKTGTSIIGRIFSNVLIWVVIGIIGAVLIQQGWSYYNSNKSNIDSKLNIDSAAIMQAAEKSIDKVKQLTKQNSNPAKQEVPETKVKTSSLKETTVRQTPFTEILSSI